MNDTIKLMQAHRSCRSYTDEPVSDAMLDQIIRAAWRGPTSINAQEVSLIVVKDAARRARIAEIAGGQPHIAQAPVFITVIIDFNKTRIGVENAGQKQIIHESMEGFGVAAVDAGITLGLLMTAARSLGLGIVPIGGIRRDPQAMIDLLGLPTLTFPLIGLCIGHIANDAPLKPRLDISTFRHNERYNSNGYAAAIDQYDKTLMSYWQQLGRSDGITWSANLAYNLKQVYFPQVKPVAAKQGLLNDK
ncbi:MAG: NADPH-dependent oxidoreductase [Proteobacteria bacterium]|nr:NADPH-dependent oxidoreductase [Pseudomonadota bacterium]